MLDENQIVRTFEEFGTGEQQILLISFVKAYAETFKQNFILGIEEPEAHLHPIAQKWFAKNIREIAKSDNVQVIITTHSPDFLDIEDLEGFIRVYKENNVTKVKQHNTESLDDSCKKLKSDKGGKNSILPYYKTTTVPDQLRGFFARKLILVEGPTEYFALPIYFEKMGYSLAKNGVEIINCQGKNNIPTIYRLFKSYDYECFCLFDADTDKGKKKNDQFNILFDLTVNESLENVIFECGDEYGYFAKDFESYMRANIDKYAEKENDIESASKQLKVKIIAQENNFKPEFINQIAKKMFLDKVFNRLF